MRRSEPLESSVRGSGQTRWLWGLLLGFAVAGFFDGILLHQILQWHHLLSLVPGVTSLRAQVVWDGYFHALMYVLALLAIAGLWRSRGDEAQTGRPILPSLLAGFGLWHVVDAVLSHWVLGIHRIRIDSPNLLLWDLGWLFVFGLAPLLLAWWLRRRRSGIGRPGTLLLLFAAVGLMGLWAAWPPQNQPFTTVVFAPGVTPAQIWDAFAETDARVAWADHEMSVFVIDIAPDDRLSFYRRGAMLVSRAGLPSGCFGWSRR